MEDVWKEEPCSNGTMQSPIKIDTTMMPAWIHAPIKYKSYFVNPKHNNKWHKGLLENNGHTIVWHFGGHGGNKMMPFKKCGKKYACPSIRSGPFGGDTHSHAYHLLAAHFHWGALGDNMKGSEHELNGRKYPLEMHLVHIEDRFINFTDGTYDSTAAGADKYGYAVLAIMFDVDDMRAMNLSPLSGINDAAVKLANPPAIREAEERQLENEHEEALRGLQEGLEELMPLDSNGKLVRSSHSEVKLRLNPGAFIRKATNDKHGCFATYFSYFGSLTTPGCNEAVTWVVFTKPLSISQVQVNAFKSRFTNNFREIETCAGCMARSPNGVGNGTCSGEGSNGRPMMGVHLIHDEIQAHKGGYWG